MPNKFNQDSFSTHSNIQAKAGGQINVKDLPHMLAGFSSCASFLEKDRFFPWFFPKNTTNKNQVL